MSQRSEDERTREPSPAALIRAEGLGLIEAWSAQSRVWAPLKPCARREESGKWRRGPGARGRRGGSEDTAMPPRPGPSLPREDSPGAASRAAGCGRWRRGAPWPRSLASFGALQCAHAPCLGDPSGGMKKALNRYRSVIKALSSPTEPS